MFKKSIKIVGFIVLGLLFFIAPARAEEAYFRFYDLRGPVDEAGNPADTFVFKLTDPTKIALARSYIGTSVWHVMGTIVQEPIPYNPGWSFHYDPSSINFFQLAAKGCDHLMASVEAYVQANLACFVDDDGIPGGFLPGCRWCPWGSVIMTEVYPDPIPPTPTPTPSPPNEPSPTPTALLGDFDNDANVDWLDYLMVVERFSRSQVALIFDINAVVANFGNQ